MVEINYGSIKVVKKNGFKKEATLVSEEFHGKRRYNSLIYGKII
jgi:RimJ/RimL family protein N-acetyltransferase